MGTLTTTSPGNLFNLVGSLTSVGQAGFYSKQAFDILEQVSYKGPKILDSKTSWCDIMVNISNGKLYAVWATDALTTQEGLLQYIKLDEVDCPEAFKTSKAQLIRE